MDISGLFKNIIKQWKRKKGSRVGVGDMCHLVPTPNYSYDIQTCSRN